MPPRRSAESARRRVARARADFSDTLAAITSCRPGQERNLYPYVRDLFITVFGYERRDLIVDTADQMGGIPDLSVLAHTGTSLRMAALLDLPIRQPAATTQWREIATQITRESGADVIEDVLDAVDGYAAEAFGLPQSDLETIWREFQTDPMLQRVKPNLPYAQRRRLGLRTGLTESDRFTRAYRTRSQIW